MKYDEFAFFNQQFSSMLKDGIPLEGALKQLCKSMRHGGLRSEMEELCSDLASGIPLDRALESCRLPELYVRMLQAGVKGNNLPGVLTLVADYYTQINYVWTRLKGVLVYPAIVLFASLAMSVLLVSVSGRIESEVEEFVVDPSMMVMARMRMVLPPVILSVIVGVLAVCFLIPPLRRHFAWRVSPFRHAMLAKTASVMSMLLRSGCQLDDAIDTLSHMEGGTSAQAEFARWRAAIAEGQTRFSEIVGEHSIFPPLFVWIVENSGEDLGGGFEQAARMYSERASHGVDMVLYGLLPVSVLALGATVLCQSTAMFMPLIDLMQQMGGG